MGEIEIKHRPRNSAVPSTASGAFLKGFLDLLTVKFLTGFGQRPQHILGSVGLASFLIGALMLIYLAGYWILSRLGLGIEVIHLSGRPLLLYSIALLLLGGQFMSIGFLAELFIAYHTSAYKNLFDLRTRRKGDSTDDEEKDEA